MNPFNIWCCSLCFSSRLSCNILQGWQSWTPSPPTWPAYPYYFFLQNLPLFSPNDNFFLQTHGLFHGIRRSEDRTPDRTYAILETFLYLITKRRFGGVGAPEGLEIAPDILIQDFSPKSETYNIFLQIIQHFSPKHTKFFSKTYKTFLQNIQNFSPESKKLGVLTFDFRRL